MDIEGIIGDEVIDQPSLYVARAKDDVDVGVQTVFQHLPLQMIQVSFSYGKESDISSDERWISEKFRLCGNDVFKIILHKRSFLEEIIYSPGEQSSAFLDTENLIRNAGETVHQGCVAWFVARENGNFHPAILLYTST